MSQDQLRGCTYFSGYSHKYEQTAALQKRMVGWEMLHSQRRGVRWLSSASHAYNRLHAWLSHHDRKEESG